MALKSRKVAIVGTGLVGSSTAFSLITQGVCEEILMIDLNKERALGEAMDLNHCIEYLNRNTKVRAGSYEECGDVDIVVITAGAPPKPGQTRIDTLHLSAKIAESIVNPTIHGPQEVQCVKTYHIRESNMLIQDTHRSGAPT